ncbi:MAG: UDP-N-acetylglucosamine--N-acetylmuramyl-(pentapeptide) pyrophosphoryl-undecaprenol N-acetylglucosamine transferase [Patescibacteria group bacterium]
MKKEKILIALSGGGTGGPVVPLLSVVRIIKRQHQQVEFIFLGTNNGPEISLIENERDDLDIDYFRIYSGKLRRYFSWRNFTDPFVIIFSFFQSLFLFIKYRPKVFFAAGAFVAVPPAWAAKILGIPVFMHQQDYRAGLANKLIAPIASLKTVTFEKSLHDYREAIWIGNPANQEDLAVAAKAKQETIKKYQLRDDLPVVLVTGGGTGADFLNNLILESLNELTVDFQIIHLCGDGKKRHKNKVNYQAYEFLPHAELLKLMVVSDLVVSRCGLGTLTELSLLGKPAILIPIPDSHQEDNAKVFFQASLVLDQKNINSKIFIKEISQILKNKTELSHLSKEIKKIIKPGAAEFLAEKIYEYSRKKN